jgi:hypothetical protein
VGPRTALDDVKKRKTLPLSGLELRPLGRPTMCKTDIYIYVYVCVCVCVCPLARQVSHQPLMMGAETIPEMLGTDSILIFQIALEDLIAYVYIFSIYNIHVLL